MKNTIRVLSMTSIALLLGLSLVNAVAGETSANGNVPLKTMSQAEYEIYRQQLDRQVKSSTSNVPRQNSVVVEKESESGAEGEPDSGTAGVGYGKGYRARMERSGGAGRGAGYRGGSMSRGGGGRNR
jgi:hypothetical protein